MTVYASSSLCSWRSKTFSGLLRSLTSTSAPPSRNSRDSSSPSGKRRPMIAGASEYRTTPLGDHTFTRTIDSLSTWPWTTSSRRTSATRASRPPRARTAGPPQGNPVLRKLAPAVPAAGARDGPGARPAALARHGADDGARHERAKHHVAHHARHGADDGPNHS